MAPRTERGLFLVLDGVDGCGKSTQAERLVEALSAGAAADRRPLHLREPGSTVLGERLRELLFDRALDLDPGVEVLLFAAARRQMLGELVAPALAAGRHVVCERFHPSTCAYQAHAGGLPAGRVRSVLAAWAGRPSPDVELILLLDPAAAAERRGAPGDRIEDKDDAFHARVAEGYRAYADEVERAVAVDGSGSVEEVEAAVWEEVRRVLA
ncbi:MAG: dTMP kinase [Planctomycetota bacterium]|jgi:dTMP kinase|nr:dTMP kinase [Planctomycetota bacterium]MDP6762859.1 dTMP kinase [Planctomycetota bacterium]MDP6988737.1 dTMP kinase [Planctomycetota bacterium]